MSVIHAYNPYTATTLGTAIATLHMHPDEIF